MAGGLFNLISYGNNNIILNGNPSKTFFKCNYCKYTNFGLQKFRLDFDGTPDIRLTTDSTFTFKVKRYADLLMDTYVVLTLPDIYSPIYHPCFDNDYNWAAYDFRWIRDIGTTIIRNIEISSGSMILQKYTGEYISAQMERDLSAEKKILFNEMTGNTVQIYDPANASGRASSYPNSYYTTNTSGAEPSIRGRQLYIPIHAWFTRDSRCAFPLIALQYNELTITVTLRPIQELFQVRDVFDTTNLYPYIQPDFNQDRFQMYRYLQTPPNVRLTNTNYTNQIRTWNSDVHLLATYCFLSKEEQHVFASEDQIYLVKDTFQYNFQNVTSSSRIKLENSMGMVSSWIFFLQRNDVNMRNEWSNYTNWPYRSLPSNIINAPSTLPDDINTDILSTDISLSYGPLYQPTENKNTGLFITGDYAVVNQKEILQTLGILFEGDYRENLFSSDIYKYIEPWSKSDGSPKEGLYFYNFCLKTAPTTYQPQGAINLSKFRLVELEITTFAPQIDTLNSAVVIVCNSEGNPIAISSKPSWQLYQYNFNLVVMEERYNILSFVGGNCGMMYAK
jgi:hypothetical protein